MKPNLNWLVLSIGAAGLLAMSIPNNFMPFAEFLDKCKIVSFAITIPISLVAAISIYRKYGLKKEIFGTVFVICIVPILAYFFILLLISSSYPAYYTSYSGIPYSTDVEAVKYEVRRGSVSGCSYQIRTEKTSKEFSSGEICIPKAFAILLEDKRLTKFRLTGRLSTFGFRVTHVAVLND